MKKLLLGLLLALAPSVALAQLDPYYQIANKSPNTQVWATAIGNYVSGTDSSYESWLSGVASNPVYAFNVQTVCGVNNNAGLIQIKVCNPAAINSWITGQFKTVFNVGGVSAASGVWAITVDNLANGLVSLQGSVFSGAWTSGGIIGAAIVFDTDIHLFAVIDQQNRTKYLTGQICLSQTGGLPGCPGILLGSTIEVLSNPVMPTYVVTFSGAGQILMPQANLLGSLPIGQSVMFYNMVGSSFTVKDFGGNVIANVTGTNSAVIRLYDNTTQNGSWAHAIGSF